MWVNPPGSPPRRMARYWTYWLMAFTTDLSRITSLQIFRRVNSVRSSKSCAHNFWTTISAESDDLLIRTMVSVSRWPRKGNILLVSQWWQEPPSHCPYQRPSWQRQWDDGSRHLGNSNHNDYNHRARGLQDTAGFQRSIRKVPSLSPSWTKIWQVCSEDTQRILRNI